MSRLVDNDRGRETAGFSPASALAALRGVALAAGLTLVGVSGAMAQEGTPAATPGSVECVAPEAGMAPATMGTPAASPATESEAAAEGTPADEALAAEAIAALENYTACYNAGEISAALALTTPTFLMELFGTDDLAQIEAAMGMVPIPTTTILSIGNVLTYDDGRVSVDSEYMSGDYQYVNSRNFLVRSGDTFLVDGEDYLPAMPDVETSAVVGFTIGDDTTPLAFDQSTSVAEIEGLILYGLNNGAERHTAALLRLPEGTAGTPVAELPAEQMMGAEIIGAVVIEPGERVELVLLNLPVGTYVLLDPAVPGSSAELTVTEPATE